MGMNRDGVIQDLEDPRLVRLSGTQCPLLSRMKREVEREVRRRVAFCYETWNVQDGTAQCPNTLFHICFLHLVAQSTHSLESMNELCQYQISDTTRYINRRLLPVGSVQEVSNGSRADTATGRYCMSIGAF
jgi:hypothetical protein